MGIRAILLVCLILVFNAFLLIGVAADAASRLTVENGVLENFQVLLLALTAIAFAFAILRGRGEIKSAAVVLFLLCILITIRELDFRNLEGPLWLIELSMGPKRDILMGCVTGTLFVYIFIRRRDIVAWIRLFWRRDAWPLYLSAAFLVAGLIIDFYIKKNVYQRFLEELLEIDGYFILLMLSINYAQVTAKQEPENFGAKLHH